jgi:hypothetical protein
LTNAPGLDLQCGTPRVVGFFADGLTSPPTSGEPALLVAVDAPATVSSGATFQYTVTLTNPTSGAIDLLPCPSYTEGLTGQGGILSSETYVLNCEPVAQLDPGASASFQMSYAVPASLPSGSVKLWWLMQVANGPLGGGVLTVS